jgi:metal transporter CNNM
MDYLITAGLLFLSAMFSGLTLGLMGLDVHALKRKARLGNKQALAILPVRERGNQLLTTLLLGNVAVNAVLAIFLGSIASGVVAGLIATALIFMFGEIIPQAVISRHAMRVGAYSAPVVGLLMKVSWPIAAPIGHMLDKMLGDEVPVLYTKRELMEIVSEHEDSRKSDLDQDEERIVHGALQFSTKKVLEVMTPRDKVELLYTDEMVDDKLRQKITEDGFSRYPVLEKEPNRIIGVLYTKDLIVAEDNVPVQDVCEHKHLRTRSTDTLDTVLAYMLKRRQHMAMVTDEVGNFLGVITLEDIIEEVIQQEILDEDDDESIPN